MAKNKSKPSKTKLNKMLAEHTNKVQKCVIDGNDMKYVGYETTAKGTIITTWECPNRHIRHFKLVE